MGDPCIPGSKWTGQAPTQIYCLQGVMVIPQPQGVTTIPPTGLSSSPSSSLGFSPH